MGVGVGGRGGWGGSKVISKRKKSWKVDHQRERVGEGRVDLCHQRRNVMPVGEQKGDAKRCDRRSSREIYRGGGGRC